MRALPSVPQRSACVHCMPHQVPYHFPLWAMTSTKDSHLFCYTLCNYCTHICAMYSFQCKNLVFWKALMWQFSLFLRYSGSGVFCTAKLSTRYSNFGRSKNKAWLIPDYYRLLPCNFFGNKTLHKRSRILVEDRAAWSLPCLGEQRQQKALLLLLLLLTVAVEEVS